MLIIAFLICFTSIVQSWGHTGIFKLINLGHAAIARVAESFINHETSNAIIEILGQQKISEIAVIY